MGQKWFYISLFFWVLSITSECNAQSPKEIYEQNNILSDKGDSLRAYEKGQAVANMEKKYHTAEKDNQLIRQQLLINRKKNEIRRKDLFLIVGVGMLLLIIFFLAIFYRNYKNRVKLDQKDLQKRKQHLEIEDLNTMMLAEEKERLQLAGSIQNGIALKLKQLNDHLSQLPGKYVWLSQNTAFKEVMRQMSATEYELKQTSQNLVPGMILQNGIYDSVVTFCNSLYQSTGLSINCLKKNELPQIEAEVQISLYRIIQELIQNVIKHAAASAVSVLFTYENDLLKIAINDNGTGFINASRERQDGMGIKNIDARIKALGGSMIIIDDPNGGTTTHINLPIYSHDV